MPTTTKQTPTLTVKRLFKQPILIARALTLLEAKRLFVADRIFQTGSPESVAGGSAQYQQSESIYMDRDIQEVAERGEFPRAGWSEAILTALVKKYGLEFTVSAEAKRRNQIDVVKRGQVKLMNSLVKFVDTVAIAKLRAEAGNTLDVAAGAFNPWATATGDQIVENIVDAIGMIDDEDEGYRGSVLLISPKNARLMLKDDGIRNALPRESRQNPVLTGEVAPMLGLDAIIMSPQVLNTEAFIVDPDMAGTIADEEPDPDEGYISATPGPGRKRVFVKVYTEDKNDDHIVRVARWPAMWIAEPNAITKMTGLE